MMHKCATSGKSSDSFVRKVLGLEAAEDAAEVKQEKKKIERPPSAAKTKKSEVQQPVSKKQLEKEKEKEPERVEVREE